MNSLPLHLRKTESLNDLIDRLKSFLHLSTFSEFIFLITLIIILF